MITSICRILILAALASAATAESVIPTRELETSITLRVHFQSQKRTVQKCNDLGAWSEKLSEKASRSGSEAIGCARMDTVDKVCDVYAVDISDTDQTDRLATLGHEVLHCLVGRYHTE